MMNFDWNEIRKECYELSDKIERQEIEKMISEGVKYTVKDNEGNIIDSLYDVCGDAYVKFTDKRNKFAKEYKKFMETEEESGNIDTFSLYSKSPRQELRINKAIAIAIVDYLNEKYNAEVYARWYVD